MSETPRTEAGKTLLAELFSYDEDDHPHASGLVKRRALDRILAIEAEAIEAAAARAGAHQAEPDWQRVTSAAIDAFASDGIAAAEKVWPKGVALVSALAHPTLLAAIRSKP